MWKEPRIHELDAPKEYQELIQKSVFFNRKGQLADAAAPEIIQTSMAAIVSWLFLTMLLLLLLSQLTSVFTQFPVQLMIVILCLLVVALVFVWWGWYRYIQAWYYFDNDNKLFTVIRQHAGDWEQIDIPYEQVESVEWSGGNNGYATINAAGFSFDTNRSSTDRFSSVTELWSQLACMAAPMTNWPITLICPSCDRSFGHHIGTAICPFDQLLLLDSTTKGRIDPDDIHPDDIGRV